MNKTLDMSDVRVVNPCAVFVFIFYLLFITFELACVTHNNFLALLSFINSFDSVININICRYYISRSTPCAQQLHWAPFWTCQVQKIAVICTFKVKNCKISYFGLIKIPSTWQFFSTTLLLMTPRIKGI